MEIPILETPFSRDRDLHNTPGSCISSLQDDDIVYSHGNMGFKMHRILELKKIPRVRLFADKSGT
jgi:hypothetical protein